MTDRRLMTRAGPALVLANVRYWSTVAPLLRAALSRWEERARAIPDPVLRASATVKLCDERFNAQVAATLATLAPRSRRRSVVEAIVALQVLYDYVDLLSEQSPLDPEVNARLFTALTDAVEIDLNEEPGSGAGGPGDYYCHREDGGYLQALSDTVRAALEGLPASGAIAEIARGAAARCAQAQILNHQASGSGSRSGIDGVREWATQQASGTSLGWQEFLAGATASVLAIHALIAAAADPRTTRADAETLDGVYISIGALSMLDSLIDREEDIAAGQLGYLQYYEDPQQLASRLAPLAREALARARELPNGAHHIVTLVGVVAYYASAPAARSDFARPLIAPLRRELAPLIAPTLALMRGWRLAKRVRRGKRHGLRGWHGVRHA